MWRLCVPDILPALQESNALLSDDERVRAGRYLRAEDRNRFIAGRSLLRRLLAGYAGVGPTDIVFRFGSHGKPLLDLPSAARHISFNLSHSSDWIVCAMTTERAIGVDVEFMNSNIDVDALGRTVFCASERETFERLAEVDRRPAFFALWSRKEAYIKAIGSGLSVSPADIEVTICPQDAPRLLRAPAESNPERWRLQTLDVAECCAASFILEAPIRATRFFEWHPSVAEAS